MALVTLTGCTVSWFRGRVCCLDATAKEISLATTPKIGRRASPSGRKRARWRHAKLACASPAGLFSRLDLLADHAEPHHAAPDFVARIMWNRRVSIARVLVEEIII
jgi:hypothetical protein